MKNSKQIDIAPRETDTTLNIHYIYINRHDVHDETIPTEVKQLATKYCRFPGSQPLEFRFWTYSQLLGGIHQYDRELARLFALVDPDFGACLADIGRIYCLLTYGGIYHDAHVYIEDSTFLRELASRIASQGLVIEKAPSPKALYGCRNKNIAGRRGNDFFDRVLQRMKRNMQQLEKDLQNNRNHRANMWRVTTMTFLEQLLEDDNLTLEPFSVERISRYSTLVTSWRIKALAKFYNDGMTNHWSVLQKHKPLLLLASCT